MQDVVRFWLDRGVDGFRVDAVNVLVKDAELRNDPPASGRFPFPLVGESAELDHVYSANRPEVTQALAALREAAGDALLVGEVYLPTAEYPRYLEHLDLVFAFELLFSPWKAGVAARGDRAGRGPETRRLGALESRLRPAGNAGRGAERPRCRGASVDAAGSGVHLPGR